MTELTELSERVEQVTRDIDELADQIDTLAAELGIEPWGSADD